MRRIQISHFGSHSRSIVVWMEKKHPLTYALPFNSWMDGEEASTDINRLKEVVKLEQFTNCLPTEIDRWVVEKRPKLLVDAAKLADEYAVLYKPFNAEQDNSWKSDNKNYADKTEK